MVVMISTLSVRIKTDFKHRTNTMRICNIIRQNSALVGKYGGYFRVKMKMGGLEIAPWRRALAILAENLSSDPNIHMVVTNVCNPIP